MSPALLRHLIVMQTWVSCLERVSLLMSSTDATAIRNSSDNDPASVDLSTAQSGQIWQESFRLISASICEDLCLESSGAKSARWDKERNEDRALTRFLEHLTVRRDLWSETVNINVGLGQRWEFYTSHCKGNLTRQGKQVSQYFSPKIFHLNSFQRKTSD